jgi:hypothetical protein
VSDFQPTHRHYKGGLYRLRLIRDSERWADPPEYALEGWVLYENEAGDLIKRRAEEFFGFLPGGQPRFEQLR